MLFLAPYLCGQRGPYGWLIASITYPLFYIGNLREVNCVRDGTQLPALFAHVPLLVPSFEFNCLFIFRAEMGWRWGFFGEKKLINTFAGAQTLSMVFFCQGLFVFSVWLRVGNETPFWNVWWSGLGTSEVVDVSWWITFLREKTHSKAHFPLKRKA